jgi:hypothetical protein
MLSYGEWLRVTGNKDSGEMYKEYMEYKYEI